MSEVELAQARLDQLGISAALEHTRTAGHASSTTSSTDPPPHDLEATNRLLGIEARMLAAEQEIQGLREANAYCQQHVQGLLEANARQEKVNAYSQQQYHKLLIT